MKRIFAKSVISAMIACSVLCMSSFTIHAAPVNTEGIPVSNLHSKFTSYGVFRYDVDPDADDGKAEAIVNGNQVQSNSVQIDRNTKYIVNLTEYANNHESRLQELEDLYHDNTKMKVYAFSDLNNNEKVTLLHPYDNLVSIVVNYDTASKTKIANNCSDGVVVTPTYECASNTNVQQSYVQLNNVPDGVSGSIYVYYTSDISNVNGKNPDISHSDLLSDDPMNEETIGGGNNFTQID